MDSFARSLASPPPAFKSQPFPLQRILVLGDPSVGAANAAWRAGLLAAEHGASLHLMPLRAHGGRDDVAQRRLRAAAWHLQERLQVPVVARAGGGSSRAALAAAAAEADLVVLRAPKWFRFIAGRWVCPDHPLRLLDKLGRPTLLVRRPATVPYQRVLAGVHEVEGAADSIITASGMAGGPHLDLLRYGVLEPRAMEGLRWRDELEAESLARQLQGRVADLARERGAARMKEAPGIVFSGSADVLLEQEYALLPELVVGSDPALLTPGLLARTMADTLVLPRRAPAAAPAFPDGSMPLHGTLVTAR